MARKARVSRLSHLQIGFGRLDREAMVTIVLPGGLYLQEATFVWLCADLKRREAPVVARSI
jgi:hypothetical protein